MLGVLCLISLIFLDVGPALFFSGPQFFVGGMLFHVQKSTTYWDFAVVMHYTRYCLTGMPSLKVSVGFVRESFCCKAVVGDLSFGSPTYFTRRKGAGHMTIDIDWEFELEKAHGVATSKEVREVITLREDGILQRFSYETALGVLQVYLIPKSLNEEGFARMEVDGLPIELTALTGNRIEIFWPLGMHEHVV